MIKELLAILFYLGLTVVIIHGGYVVENKIRKMLNDRQKELDYLFSKFTTLLPYDETGLLKEEYKDLYYFIKKKTHQKKGR